MKTPKKATVHVSIDPALSEKLRRVCQTMGLPMSRVAPRELLVLQLLGHPCVGVCGRDFFLQL